MTPLWLEARGLAGVRWASGSLPVIALHGWLDNAHSFLPLSEHLRDLDLIALDFPGHGHSRPRPEGCRYLFDDYLFDVCAAANALGLDRFHLLGHSLGGAVASMLAAACPERVISVVLIEALGPLTTAEQDTVAAWRRALAGSRPRRVRAHSSRDSAIAARVASGDLGQTEAAILADRGLIENEKGFHWSHDRRLTWPAPHRYTEGQVLAMLAAIEAPALVIHADPISPVLGPANLQRRLAALRQRQLISHPGGHHLHMQHAGRLAPAIQEFFHEHHA